jgi:hypothetical protein
MAKLPSLLVGITKDRELYFVEIEMPSENHKHFSMSGFTVRPTKRDDAIEEVREQLEDGELWKQAVEAGKTTLGLTEWVDFALDVDGELGGFDNSLFPDEPEIDGVEYVYESGSCGQHEEDAKNIVHWCIAPELYATLMALWKTYHLKKYTPKLPPLPTQDLEAEAMKCVQWLNENE